MSRGSVSLRLLACATIAGISLLAACGGGSSGGGAPHPYISPTPGLLSASPFPVVLSLSQAGGVPSAVTLTLTQGGLGTQPTITTTQTCYTSPPGVNDVLYPPSSFSVNFASSTGIYTQTEVLTGKTVGSCVITQTSSANPTSYQIPVTVTQ